jgi:hypothetical protein
VHSKEKLRAGKRRIIVSLSAVDYLVQATINALQIRTEIEHVYEIPSLPGMGMAPLDPPRLRACIEKFVGSRFSSLDFSGFDWSQQPFEKLSEAMSRAQLSISGHPDHMRAVLNETLVAMNSVFCLRDGTLFVAGVPGVMNSGCLYTASGNSRIAVATIFYATGKLGVAMGDDGCASPDFEEKEAHALAESLGRKVKVNVIYPTDDFEFCSNRWKFDGKQWKVSSLNKDEIAYKALANRVLKQEQVAAWSNLVQQTAFDKMVERERGFCVETDWDSIEFHAGPRSDKQTSGKSIMDQPRKAIKARKRAAKQGVLSGPLNAASKAVEFVGKGVGELANAASAVGFVQTRPRRKKRTKSGRVDHYPSLNLNFKHRTRTARQTAADYAYALQHPFVTESVRLHSGGAVATAVSTAYYHIVLTVAGSGQMACQFNFGGVSGAANWILAGSPAVAVAGGAAWTGIFAGGAAVVNPSSAGILGSFRNYRPTAAALNFRSIGSDAGNAGEMFNVDGYGPDCATWLAAQTLDQAFAACPTVLDMKSGATVVFRPQDASNTDFFNTTATTAQSQNKFGCLNMVATNLTVGTGLLIQAVVHYEFEGPISDSFLVDLSAGGLTQADEDKALNMVTDMPYFYRETIDTNAKEPGHAISQSRLRSKLRSRRVQVDEEKVDDSASEVEARKPAMKGWVFAG